MNLALQLGKRLRTVTELLKPLGLPRWQLSLHLGHNFRDPRDRRSRLRHANLHWLPRFLAGKVCPLLYDRLAETQEKPTTFWEWTRFSPQNCATSSVRFTVVPKPP